MNRARFPAGCRALLVAVALHLPASAAVDWRFPVGLAYASGFHEVMGAMDDNFHPDDDWICPVGLSFQPYAEFDFGLGIGASLGPNGLYFFGDGLDIDVSYTLPLGLDLRYTFLRKGNVSPYVRAGLKYIVAGGDWLHGGDPGFFGAAGVEFLRTKRVNVGLEVGYCSADVEVEDGPYGGPKDVKPCKFLVSVFAIF